MKLQIYSEDTHCKAFEILAKKAVEHWFSQLGGNPPKTRILANPVTVSEMYLTMPSLANAAKKDKFGCIAFVVDREGPCSAHHRELELQRIRHAFDALCQDPPSQLKVMLIVVDICLESWFLADKEGLKAYVTKRKRKSSDYQCKQHRTDCDGRNSREHASDITQLFQRVEKSLGAKPHRLRYDKDQSDRVAKCIDPVHGSKWNESLKYFCEMVPCKQDGCAKRQSSRT